MISLFSIFHLIVGHAVLTFLCILDVPFPLVAFLAECAFVLSIKILLLRMMRCLCTIIQKNDVIRFLLLLSLSLSLENCQRYLNNLSLDDLLCFDLGQNWL